MIQAGTDSTGVPTDMVSMNSTVKFTFVNKATFFGIHVTSTPVDLSFSKLTIASGAVIIQTHIPLFFLIFLNQTHFQQAILFLGVADKAVLPIEKDPENHECGYFGH